MKIEIKAGPNAGQQHDIEGTTVVGRDPDSATLVIDDAEASRRHASLTPGGDGVVVEDLGSTNGTFVNGERVEGTRNAGAGDEIRIGNTVIEVQSTIEATRMSDVPEPSDPDVTAIGSPVPDASVPGPSGAGAPTAEPPAAPEPPPLPEPPAAPEPVASSAPPPPPPAEGPSSPPPTPGGSDLPGGGGPPSPGGPPPPSPGGSGPPPPPPGGGSAPPPPPPPGQGFGAPPQSAPPQYAGAPPQYSPPGSPPGSYPPVAYGGGGSGYPVDYDVQYPSEGIDRWRPFFHGFLLIPHWFALFFVFIGVAITNIFVPWIVLFTGRFPEGLFNFYAGYMRWTNRVNAYYAFMVDKYPPFSLDEEPQYPVQLRIDPLPGGKIARWRPFFQWILLIPHWIVLMFLGIAAGFVLLVAWFAVVFTRRWPEGLFKFQLGVNRWSARVTTYQYSMTAEYPPFKLDP